ncbi:hypothetical protein Q4517_15045 [Tenacibaculum sp. 1_MG-2023]|uniref:hypothetical protein n=1 Tax=Tenacibaculum sp. 1_MG-2023 TaxID=3062653 RepID=UPI0026E43CC2|nr:hypothetical protein [Tenacibaculum sp. 1_MG-2023]MDO6676858.1 hypothetical protein [Tenacibaculum sp. 1_MG-2023]
MNFIILSEFNNAAMNAPIINNTQGCDMIFSIRDFFNGVLFTVFGLLIIRAFLN